MFNGRLCQNVVRFVGSVGAVCTSDILILTLASSRGFTRFEKDSCKCPCPVYLRVTSCLIRSGMEIYVAVYFTRGILYV